MLQINSDGGNTNYCGTSNYLCNKFIARCEKVDMVVGCAHTVNHAISVPDPEYRIDGVPRRQRLTG